MNHSVLCNDGKFSISETNDIFIYLFIYLFQYYNYIFLMLLSRPHNQILVFLFKFLIFMNAHLTHVSTYSLVPFRAKKTERSS
jgi:hypothetical protein